VRIACAFVLVAIALAGCADGAQHRAKLSSEQDLSFIEASRTPVRTGVSGAPVNALVVSGTITNTGSVPLRCRPTAFLLIDESGNAFMPKTQWCDVPSIAPRRSAGFTATFTPTEQVHLELRFVHPDGTYEAHVLKVPPA
jgi:hypothetical protein